MDAGVVSKDNTGFLIIQNTTKITDKQEQFSLTLETQLEDICIDLES